jgi:hypothetical protein
MVFHLYFNQSTPYYSSLLLVPSPNYSTVFSDFILSSFHENAMYFNVILSFSFPPPLQNLYKYTNT